MSHFWHSGRFSGMDVAHTVSHLPWKRGFWIWKWLTGWTTFLSADVLELRSGTLDEPFLALREVFELGSGLQDEPLLALREVLEYGSGSHSEPLTLLISPQSPKWTPLGITIIHTHSHKHYSSGSPEHPSPGYRCLRNRLGSCMKSLKSLTWSRSS